jgi:hypothetical protein
MAGRIPKPSQGAKHGFFRWFANSFTQLTDP